MRLNLNNSAAYAWLVVGLLWPVALLNYLDRQMLSSIRMSMRADIPSIANDQDFGTLMAVFMWVYALLSPVGGYVADRFNRRWTVIGSLLVWSAVTWLTGQMHTFSQMLWCRAAMGISEAFYMPAALALIVDYHTGPTRGRAVGMHQSGIYCGLALGGDWWLHRANGFLAGLFHMVWDVGGVVLGGADATFAQRGEARVQPDEPSTGSHREGHAARAVDQSLVCAVGGLFHVAGHRGLDDEKLAAHLSGRHL